MFSFIPIIIAIMIINLLYIRRNNIVHKVIHNVIHKASTLIKEDRDIKRIYLMMFIFYLPQLILSSLGFPSYLDIENCYFVFSFSIINTVAFIIYGMHKKGIQTFFSDIYIDCGSGIFYVPINILVNILNIFVTFVVKTLMLPTRLIANTYIGHCMHEAISPMPYGSYINSVILMIKMITFVVQTYLFCTLTIDMYKTLCLPKVK